ncbi:MAG: hypothetical protein NT113_22325 [Hyphomicrobiales bacterium]|nr:hypothetical protein [Hyphomicrobiales bacterium]
MNIKKKRPTRSAGRFDLIDIDVDLCVQCNRALKFSAQMLQS